MTMISTDNGGTERIAKVVSLDEACLHSECALVAKIEVRHRKRIIYLPDDVSLEVGDEIQVFESCPVEDGLPRCEYEFIRKLEI